MTDSPYPPGSPPPVTIWEIDRKLGEMAGNVRSIKQTIDESVIPQIQDNKKNLEDYKKENDVEVDKLKSRFVYALTIIGSAVGAGVYLFFNPPGGGLS